MNSQTRLRVVLPCLLLLAGVSVYGRPNARERAPRFNAKTTTGEKFTNESTKGKVVLLEFWTTWCPYCFADAPIVDKLNKECSDKGLIVLSVNVGESKKTVNKYLAVNSRTTRIVMTEDTNLAAMYEATVYPIYVVIDRDGNIVGTRRGAIGEDGLRDMLADAGIGSRSDASAKDQPPSQ